MGANMFWVKHKETNMLCLVYQVCSRLNTGINFLVYINGHWRYENAQHFEPYDGECRYAPRKKTLNEG